MRILTGLHNYNCNMSLMVKLTGDWGVGGGGVEVVATFH